MIPDNRALLHRLNSSKYRLGDSSLPTYSYFVLIDINPPIHRNLISSRDVPAHSFRYIGSRTENVIDIVNGGCDGSSGSCFCTGCT